MSDDSDFREAWVERLGKCTGNHLDSMVAVAEGLVFEMPDLINRLDQAIAAESAADVQRLGHTLKSSFRYVCDGDEVRNAAELELCGKQNRMGDAASLLVELKTQVERWRGTIQAWIDVQ